MGAGSDATTLSPHWHVASTMTTQDIESGVGPSSFDAAPEALKPAQRDRRRPEVVFCCRGLFQHLDVTLMHAL